MNIEQIRFSAVKPNRYSFSGDDFTYHRQSFVRNILTERQISTIVYGALSYTSTVMLPWPLRCAPSICLERNDSFEIVGCNQNSFLARVLNEFYSPIIYNPKMTINALSSEEIDFLAIKLMVPKQSVVEYVSSLLRMTDGYAILRSRGV